MIDPKLEHYLMQTIDQKEEDIVAIESYAAEHHVPIMEPLGIEFLQQMIRIKQPKRILEIGAAIGYSAIQMAKSDPECEVVSIERDEERYNEAIRNINKLGLENRVRILFGDAFDLAEELKAKGPYDVLFIDAAKGQYQRFFELFTPELESNGMVISDNVLFKGFVADDPADGSNIAKIARKIRTYNEWLIQHPDYQTTIVPVGDGVAISVKR
ncbi:MULTISPECIES: O-methyltransferase [Pontibacillus]|uniref:tRNA 5-hydroxyuridine methyltransferase n=1 Tax=Pontibacillus chungwhensis TaxID=265426 RepID=A0ABY8UV29_9BACI|nr:MULTISPECIES: O-methyltransferase [Pontibacillus]MCD5323666.1 O-methyltransferase [Pontibacillus sp. HN14]WIF97033.1 O-methyltransferase [Pontibacillus chungwhensis]